MERERKQRGEANETCDRATGWEETTQGTYLRHSLRLYMRRMKCVLSTAAAESVPGHLVGEAINTCLAPHDNNHLHARIQGSGELWHFHHKLCVSFRPLQFHTDCMCSVHAIWQKWYTMCFGPQHNFFGIVYFHTADNLIIFRCATTYIIMCTIITVASSSAYSF